MVAASLPPKGFPGLDSEWSQLVDAPDGAGVIRRWHLLDNAPQLVERGLKPTGTIVCVHGNPTWSYLWRTVLRTATETATHSAQVWRVIAVDQLEMGYSERSGRSRFLAERIADLTALTDALKLSGPVVTLGHDWGGLISCGWALAHPQQCAGVMLLNTAVHQPDNSRIPLPLRLAIKRQLLTLTTRRTPAFLASTYALAKPKLNPAVRRALRAPYSSPDKRAGIRDFVADIPVDDSRVSWREQYRIAEDLRSLSLPVLLLWGVKDPIFRERYLADLQDRLPHADVHRFEGAGHLVIEDVDCASVIFPWLQQNFPAQKKIGHGDQKGCSAEYIPLWSALSDRFEDDSTALVQMGEGDTFSSLSWRELSLKVCDFSLGLARQGVQPGDRVSLLVSPGIDLTVALYACMRMGLVVVIADAGLGIQGLSRAIRGAKPEYLLGSSRTVALARLLGWPGRKITLKSVLHHPETVAETGVESATEPENVLFPVPQPEMPAAVLFTSGSTGPAKGVLYTHRQVSALVAAIKNRFSLDGNSGLVAGFAPFVLLGPALGVRSVSPSMNVTKPKTLTAVAVAEAVSAASADLIFASPAAVMNICSTAEHLSRSQRAALNTVKTLLSAGAPLALPLLNRAQSIFHAASIHTPYGMTEALLLTDITREELAVAALGSPENQGVCAGQPIAGVQIRISPFDEQGKPLAHLLTDQPGVTGEVVVSAEHLKERYDQLWQTEQASRYLDFPGERWHRTGDVGHLDQLGRLWIEGRLAHLIFSASGVVTPVGPEQKMEQLAPVRRAALVGVGPRGTQQLVAVIEPTRVTRRARLASTVFADAIRKKTSLPIAAVLIAPELPTDVRHNSKIDRTALSLWAGEILSGKRMSNP